MKKIIFLVILVISVGGAGYCIYFHGVSPQPKNAVQPTMSTYDGEGWSIRYPSNLELNTRALKLGSVSFKGLRDNGYIGIAFKPLSRREEATEINTLDPNHSDVLGTILKIEEVSAQTNKATTILDSKKERVGDLNAIVFTIVDSSISSSPSYSSKTTFSSGDFLIDVTYSQDSKEPLPANQEVYKEMVSSFRFK